MLVGVRATVLTLTALGAALRFGTLGLQSFDYDEVFTVGIVHRHFGGMLAEIPRSESTPPLYYTLAWAWAKLFGTGEVGLRALSALFGTATIPVAYAAGRTLVSRRAGIFTAGFVAVSPMLVWYSQEARSYALFVLLGSISLVFFAQSRVASASSRPLAAWAVAAALMLATHYFAVFLVLPEAAWLLSLRRRGRDVARAIGVVLVACLALLPLAVYQAREGFAEWISVDPLVQRAKNVLVEFLWVSLPSAARGSLLAVAIFSVGAFFVLRRADRKERDGALLGLGIGGSATLVPFVLALGGLDYFLGRNLIGAWVPLAIFVAGGLAARRAGVAGTAVAGALAVGALAVVVSAWFLPGWHRQDWRAAAGRLPPAAVIVVHPDVEAVTLRHYAGRLRELPATGATVREIVIVGYLYGHNLEDRFSLPPRFRKVGEARLAGDPRLLVIHYASSVPGLVRAADVKVRRSAHRPAVLVMP